MILIERFDILLARQRRRQLPRVWCDVFVWTPSGRRAVVVFFD